MGASPHGGPFAAGRARRGAGGAPRADNRLALILDEAARLFRAKGYAAASMRDIAAAADMLPGSLYYHFASKEALLVAVYAEGVRRISEAVERAIAGKRDPWERLEAGCIGHLEALLQESDYAQVVIRVRPSDAPAVAAELVRLRDGYESVFRTLIDALPLGRGADRRALRLMLVGALNWSQTWYRKGREKPREIARTFVRLLRTQLET
ncbi:MAG: TetR/AcrR family transcriptional regulator [Burkholderiales bacterium]|nr:TetR/AcrR family transcriptional regulator [Burkholderiales bacterium]